MWASLPGMADSPEKILFDRHKSEIGPVLFEYYFLMTVHEVGLSVFNIEQIAEIFLINCSDLGLKPSFTLEPHPGEANIQRSTPGVALPGDAPDQRVWRLRRRRHYDGINHFLSLTNLTDPSIAHQLNFSCTFDDFIARSEIAFEESDEIMNGNHENFTNFCVCGDNHPTVVRNRKCRSGFMAKHIDGSLSWSDECKAILDDQYIEFCEAFLKEPFK